MTLELMSTSTVRVQEIQYLSTASASTEYEYPSPECLTLKKTHPKFWKKKNIHQNKGANRIPPKFDQAHVL